MSIKKFCMALIAILVSCNVFAQQRLQGYYLLSDNYNYSYIRFEGDNFYLATMSGKDLSAEELYNKAGSGKFQLTRNKLILLFDSTKQLITDFTSDSLSASFQTNPGVRDVQFSVSLHFSVPEFDNNYFYIETDNKEYAFPIKNRSGLIHFTDSIPIKSIWLGVMGYDKRQLPYDERFNSFIYNYNLNDKSNKLAFIRGEKWSFSIKESKGQTIITDKNRLLKKADERDMKFIQKIPLLNGQK